jgi:CheY-like chemotaxis protein
LRGAEQALQSCRLSDVVFSDVRLPGMSGIELLKRIRIRHNHPIVILTVGFDQGAVEAAPSLTT